jgi:phosphatidylglycerol:prolipoprotein diacylglycerol transferase
MQRDLLAEPRIGSYSVFLLLAFLTGYLVARSQSGKAGIEGRHIDNQALLIAAISLLGARLFSWLFYFPPGVGLWKALLMPGGGLVFYGGMVFAIASVVIYSWITRLPLKNLFDLWAAPVALGLAIGRVGCFMAGCCWGDVCIDSGQTSALTDSVTRWQIYTVPWLSGPNLPWAVHFPMGTGAHEQQQQLGLIDATAESSLPVHPAQLYEALSVLALSVALYLRFLRRPPAGTVAGALGVGYGLIRFGVEFFRADNPPIYVGLTLSQVISLSLIAGGFWLLHLVKEREPRTQMEPQSGVESEAVVIDKPSVLISKN